MNKFMAEQPPLPFPHFTVRERDVEWLRLANAGQYSEKKFWFYPFKTRFLRAHALPDGCDLQIITLKCWCGDGIWRGIDHTLPQRLWQTCERCNGSSVYDVRRIALIRWQLNGHLFHEPDPGPADRRGMEYKETFRGLIKHPEVPERAARRAMERLFLRHEPGRFYDLWMARYRGWRDMKMNQATWRMRRVKILLSFTKQDEVPF